MPANLENSALATGLRKVSFHSNPKERQCQTMFKILKNCNHLTRQKSNAQNLTSEASTICEMRTLRCASWILKRQRNHRSNYRYPFGSYKKQEISRKNKNKNKNIYFCFIYCAKTFDCVDHNKLWIILKEMGIPDHLTCLLRNLYAGQEARVRTGHGTTDWLQIRKGVCHPAYLTYM